MTPTPEPPAATAPGSATGAATTGSASAAVDAATRHRELVRVVVAGFVALLSIGGWTNYSLPVYLQHLTADRGLPLSAVAAGTSIAFVSGSVATLVTGRIINRRDTQPMIIFAGALGGLSVAAIGQVTTVWQAYIAYIGMGVAFIACGAGPVTVSVLRHADPSARATQIAMTSMGMSMGGVVISPITALTINALGFSRATPLLGLVFFTVVALVAIFVMPPARRRSPPGPRPRHGPPRPMTKRSRGPRRRWRRRTARPRPTSRTTRPCTPRRSGCW